jgi:hypothetical protein
MAEIPACWGWVLLDDNGSPSERFDLFHAGRCALCGRAGPTVEDHDHVDQLVRGRLCASCNVVEGRSDSRLVVRYRRKPPSVLLGVTLNYVSWRRESAGSQAVTAVLTLRRPGYERHLLTHPHLVWDAFGRPMASDALAEYIQERLAEVPPDERTWT